MIEDRILPRGPPLKKSFERRLAAPQSLGRLAADRQGDERPEDRIADQVGEPPELRENRVAQLGDLLVVVEGDPVERLTVACGGRPPAERDEISNDLPDTPGVCLHHARSL